VETEAPNGVKTQENQIRVREVLIASVYFVEGKMCAHSDRQTLKRNTPENSEHVDDIPFRRIRHVTRITAATVKGFQELSTCKTNGHKGVDRGIMELEMEKLIGKKNKRK